MWGAAWVAYQRCGDVVCDAHSTHTLKLNDMAIPDPSGTDCVVCDDCYATVQPAPAAPPGSPARDAGPVHALAF